MSLKENLKIKKKRIKIRKKWKINPATRIKRSDKIYKRSKNKKELMEIVELVNDDSIIRSL